MKKIIACLLAGTLVAAVPGELILTEQVYAAEDLPYYDEVPADEITDADEVGDIAENDIYESDETGPEEADAPYADAEADSFSMSGSGDLAGNHVGGSRIVTVATADYALARPEVYRSVRAVQPA